MKYLSYNDLNDRNLSTSNVLLDSKFYPYLTNFCSKAQFFDITDSIAQLNLLVDVYFFLLLVQISNLLNTLWKSAEKCKPQNHRNFTTFLLYF